MKQIVNTKSEINFMGLKRGAVIMSLIIIAVSIGSLVTRGLNFGIDFTGGALIEVSYPEKADLDGIRLALDDAGFDRPQVQEFGTDKDVLIRLMPEAVDAVQIEDAEGANEQAANRSEVAEKVMAVLKAANPEVVQRRVDFVGPQVGEELTEQGGLAMIYALIMILAYVAFRFQWKFAVGSVAALVHDVIITLGIFSLFQLPFDLSVLAAVLAVIGYSLNDTIVVFDRIRENFHKIRKGTSEGIINTSINQMLSRTLTTSATTLVVLLALFFLGGEAIHAFSQALIIGVIVGTYSSIYTASTVTLALNISTADLMPDDRETKGLDQMP